ncbi:MAG: hypothetical protein ACLFTT_14320 [Candidatus Hydrogenedentota bacterium]
MRNNYRLTVLITVLLVGACALAVAVPPAYTGPMGNPEEPAMRPFKWLWHGVKAVGYRSTNGLRMTRQDERVRTLVKGTGVGVFQGGVELVDSVGRGTLHAVPPGHGDYKELGKLNAHIRQWEPLQGTEAGNAGESADANAGEFESVPPPLSGEDAETRDSAGAMTGEEHAAPAASPEPAPEEGTAPEEPAAAGEAHRARWPVATWQWDNDDSASAPAEETLSSVERAQRRYVGERAQLNEHNDGRGNLLRLGR